VTLLAEIWAEARPVVIVSAFSLSLMTAIELLFPREKHSLDERLTGLAIWAVSVPISMIVLKLFSTLWATIGIRPLVNLPMSFDFAGVAAVVLAPVAAALIYDFFFYWFHRAQHALAWRFHAVHHSIRELNTVNSYHHVTEPIFQSVFLMLPVSLIVADTGPIVPVMLILLHLQAVSIHSSAKIDIGPLRLFFCDNRFHRIHHSLEERHFEKNFGAFTTLWDRLFGTAWFPTKDEWPATGLAEIDQPRDLRSWLELPTRLRQRKDQESVASASAQ
jgi:sterol desaturase/sphingolipid hydroxylase (fatty acid hydroxylase superfamily)